MKKKKPLLSKKLLLKKDAIANLNEAQQASIAGGMPVTTWSVCCVKTNEATCPDDCVRTHF
ncbi:class I lanthipeptide [Chitinophaga vietnamensis]|uniref:class I lanthipeptide n=1 Tax=Chitinophaga vietnamensis TaxID=2593957 RepID=UPI0011773B42|nr:class I lanthipeptide [Chitinophaga vietnamensis]